MRTPRELRLAALAGVGISLLAGLVASYLVHLLFGGAGRGGFVGFNPGGLLEGLAFVAGFTLALGVARRALRVPSAVLLSLGLLAPPSAARAAQRLAVADGPHALGLAGGLALLREHGRPVGVHDAARDRTTAWEDLVRVPGAVAVTELRPLLAQAPFVVVADGERAHGVVTREMYLLGLWGRT